MLLIGIYLDAELLLQPVRQISQAKESWWCTVLALEVEVCVLKLAYLLMIVLEFKVDIYLTIDIGVNSKPAKVRHLDILACDAHANLQPLGNLLTSLVKLALLRCLRVPC